MTRNSFFVIGVTGGSGSGKSTAAAMLGVYGGLIIDADKLSHETILKGKPAYREIVEYFGESILNANGEIDRKNLGGVVFGKPEALAALERIIHPRVCGDMLEIIERARNGAASGEKKYSFAVIDAPLLIEAGMNKHCDSTWLITAPTAEMEARIIRRDNITPEQARARLQSRRGDDWLASHADVVIENNGGLKALREKVQTAYENA